jgi:hypothetical protein
VSSAGRSGSALKPARLIPLVVAVALLCTLAPPASSAPRPGLRGGGPLPLAFEPNQGQADDTVKFLARGRGYGLFLTPTETVLVLAAGARSGLLARRPGPEPSTTSAPAIVRMRLAGADPHATVSGVSPLPGRSHYFVGGRERWRRDVPTFGRVRYSEVYRGVGLVFYGTERELEYDFVVAPGADPGVVELAFDGADDLRIDADGNLVIATAAGALTMRRPVIYQDTESGRQPIEGGYVVEGRRVRFRVAAWDASRPLVIDPVLGYSTYLGGGSNDQGFGIAIDAAGNAYVTGSTISTDFPLAGAPAQGTRSGDTDVFVARLDPTGTTLLYSTYLGGSGADLGTAIAVDLTGNAYVTGSTTSSNFPVQGAFQGVTRGGSEAFVAKLDPNGSALVYSTYLGSNTDDFAFGIALDAAGNAYVTGSTVSATFPNNGAVVCQGTKRTGTDAFVARVDATGATLGYCRFAGGNGEDIGQAIAADTAGNVWFAGSTTSADLVSGGAIQSSRGGALDGFVGKLTTTGALAYLTYLGGLFDDEVLAVAADTAGNAYVAGSTGSANFPTVSPLQASLGGGTDAFVAKVNAAGSAVMFSTFLGGGGDDVANGVAVHPTDFTVYVAGSTRSVDFPILTPLQNGLAGGLDAFVTKINAAGSGLVYSTHLGGQGDDAAQAMAVDADGVAYLTGTTESPAFPTAAPIQNAAGLQDAFVTQVADGGIIQFTATTYQANENTGTVTVSVQRTGDVSAAASVEFLTSDGTATAGADYLEASGTLTFGAGQVIATFTLTLVDDAVGDGDETVTLTLRNPSGGAVLGARRTATLTLVDNEPAINFSAATYSVAENRSPAVITVTRSGPTGGTVTVQFSTADGGATAGGDYTTVGRTLTFAAGVRSVTVSVPILKDTLAEGTETVNLTLSNVSGGTPPALLGVRPTATLNITDDDVGGVLQFSAATFSVAETAPTATITATRSGGAAGGVTVDYAVTDGTAQAGADYTTVTGTLTFAAGQTSRTFTVPIVNDTAAEGNETVNLTLSNVLGGGLLGGRREAVLTIVDDEPTVAFASDTFTVAEGAATATITVRRSGVAAGAATVDFSTSNGTGVAGVHYTPVSGTLSFPAGTTTRTFTVPIINDTAFSGPRTVRLSLSNATGAVTIVPPSQATLTISDNDVAGTIQLSAPVYVFAENAGSALITVSRSGGTASGATIDFATSDGTALAGADYTFAGGTLTFGAGETTRTLSVPLTNDALAEGVETVNIQLSNPAGGAVLGARSTAVLRIVDDELALAFSAPNYAGAEGGGSAAITVELTGVSTTNVTVGFATSNGTATSGLDYTSATGTLVFPPGGTATGVRTMTFAVPILQDTLAEGSETVNLTLSSPTPAGPGGAQLVAARSTAVLDVADDDLGGMLEFDVAAEDPFFRAPESAGTATIRVRRTGGAASGVTVDYATADATATAGLDYTATSGRLTFGAGETVRTFTIPLLNDTLGEGSETVNLTLLPNPGGGGALGTLTSAKLEIQDDEPHVRLSSATYPVNGGAVLTEGSGFVTVTVERGGVDTATVTVDFATADRVPAAVDKAVGGVDYTAVTGTLTFAPGVRTRTFTVPLLNDSIPEPAEKFDVLLSNPTISAGAVTLVGPARAEVTITDEDIGGTIQFSAPTSTVNENGGEAIVTVTRTGGQAGGVSVLFETGEAFAVSPPLVTQTAAPGTDYTPPAMNTRLTFGSGETAKIVRIPILTDAANEGVELLHLRVSAPQPTGAPGTPIIGPQAITTISIVDAQPTVQFGLAEFVSSEGQPVATVTVERTAAFGRLTVDYATGDLPGACPPPAVNSGRACAGLDYVATAGTLTFEPGVTSQSFTVRLLDNQAVDADKFFEVTLSNLQPVPPAAAAFGPRTTSRVKIRENDRGGAFLVSGASVGERDGTVSVVVSRTGGSGGPVTVDFSARRCGFVAPPCDFPARETNGMDPLQLQHFVPIDAQPLTFQAGELSKTIVITIVDNAIAEGSRNFAVSVRNGSPLVMQDGQGIGPQANADALVNIAEDELYFVNLSAEDYSASEEAQEGLITVRRSGLPAFLAMPLTVDMIAVAGSLEGEAPPAVAGLDFIDLAPPGGVLAARDMAFTFAPNETVKTFRVPFLDDDVVDGPKAFLVFINDTTPRNTDSPRGPGITFPSAATLVVNDGEVGGTIEFAAATYSVAEDVAGGDATITLSRSGPLRLAEQVTVLAETGDLFGATTPPQTGVPGNDYTSRSTTVTFAAGATTATFTVPVANDPGDGVKTVNLRISNPLPNIGAVPVLGPRTTAVLRIVDAAQTIGFTLPNFDVSEAAGVATVQIERTGDVSAGTAVTLSTLDPPPPTAPTVTAVPGTDYQTTSGVVTFGPGQTVAIAQVPLIDNKVVNPDKIFGLRLTNPQPPFAALADATVTLKDDDVAGVIGFASAGFVAAESSGQGLVTLVRSGGTAGCPVPLAGPPPSCPDATLVSLSTADGTATQPGDYTALTNFVVEFGAGELAKLVPVTVTADVLTEGTETVTLTLSNPLPAGAGVTPRGPTVPVPGATLQIVESEFRIGATAYPAGEATGRATITVVRVGDATGISTLGFTTVTGTAIPGTDFTGTTGTLTFNPGDTVMTLDVVLTDDGIAETDESFDVVFSAPTGATIARDSCASATPASPALVATCTVTISILDNESGGILSFSQPVYDATEPASVTATATITVRRIVGGAGDVTVDFSAVDGTSLSGTAYALTPGTLTFGAGETSKTFTVGIPPNGTIGVQTATLLLSNATGGAVIATPGTATLRITDSGDSVGFETLGYTVDENAGLALVTVHRTGSAGTVQVDFATSDGTATAGGDYTATATTVTFPAGTTTRTVMVPIGNDAVLEPSESLTLTLSNPRLVPSLTPVAVAPDSCATSTATTCTAPLTIFDDEQGGVIQFTSASYTVAENGVTALVALSRSGGLAGGVSVTFTATPGTAVPGDFSVPSATVTFGPGQVTAMAAVTINDNLVAEADRTVDLAISTPLPAGLAGSPVLGLRTTATLTIQDNEPRLAFGAPTFSVTEGSPVATITVTRTGDPTVEALVDFATSDGSATAGADYTMAGGTLTFPAGFTSRTFTVPIANDNLLEDTETVLLTLSNPRSNPVSPGRVTVTGDNPATLVINEDDRAGTIAFNASTASVNETAGTLTVTVTRTGGNAGGVEVGYSATDGSALSGLDYGLASGTVTFGVGETARTFTVTINNRPGAQGNRVFSLQLAPPTLPAVLGPPSLLTVTIVDMDPTFRFSAPGYSAAESGAATITVERLGSTAGVATVTVQTGDLFAPIAGAGQAAQTATPTATPVIGDYTSVNRVLTFANGVRSVTTTVPITADTKVEGNETVNLRLTAPAGAAIVNNDGAAVLTILDNDQGGEIQFKAATYTVTEGTALASIVIVRTGGSGGPVTVDFETEDGTGTATEGTNPAAGADYTSVQRMASASTPVVFNAGVMSQTVTIPILNDTRDEPAETVALRLSNPTGGATLGARSTATLTINDNDVAGIVQFSQALYTVSETAASVDIKLTRSGGAASDVTVLFTTTGPGGAAGAIDPTHYTSVTTTATFAAGETTKTVTIPLSGDNANAEGSKFVNLTLSNPGGGATLGARTSAVLKILDDEDTVQFAAAAYRVAEGGTATITLERSGTIGTFVVGFATAPGTGQAGVDYVTAAGSVTFGPGVRSRTFSVRTIANTVDEGDRTVTLMLNLVSAPPGADLGDLSTTTLTIVDNDQGGQIRFSAGGYSVKENNGFVTITVMRSGGVAGPVTVDYTTVDGTAVAGLGLDYTTTSGTLTFSAGATARQFRVPITPNTLEDGDRSFTIRLSAPTGGATLGTPDTASVTIKEDDEGGIITFSALTFSASECAALPCEAVLQVARSGGAASNVAVDFATVDGTATALADYTATTGTLTFGYLQTGQKIRIPLQIEPGAQPLKSFSVILSNPRGGAILGARPAAEVRITDTR